MTRHRLIRTDVARTGRNVKAPSVQGAVQNLSFKVSGPQRATAMGTAVSHRMEAARHVGQCESTATYLNRPRLARQ